MARQLVDSGLALHDPLWHMPLWADYHRGIESDIADIVNTGRNAMAGAINAATLACRADNFEEALATLVVLVGMDRLWPASPAPLVMLALVALLVVDLEGFRALNQRLGFAAGDRLLALADEVRAARARR